MVQRLVVKTFEPKNYKNYNEETYVKLLYMVAPLI